MLKTGNQSYVRKCYKARRKDKAEMKKFYIFKLIQMGIFILYVIFILKFVLQIESLNSFETTWVATDKAYIVMMITVAIFFIFIIIDLIFLKKIHIEQQGIDKITYLDPVTGGLNRYSCDMMLEKYDTEEIRPWLGCFIFTLENLPEINREQGREQGNMLIKNFNDILSKTVGNKGIVARNSPNHFLAVLKKCDETSAEKFLSEIENVIRNNNADNTALPVKYRYGMSLNCKENKATVSQLIALAQLKLN